MGQPIFPVDFNVIRKTFVAEIAKVTNLTAILEEPETQNSPRPPAPYFSFKIITPAAKSGDDDKRNVPDSMGNPTVNWLSGGVRKMSVSFNCYGTSHEEAYNYMTLWQTALDLENIQEDLRRVGIAVWLIETVADLSQLLNTGYEGRAHLDVQFGIAVNLQSNLGEMDSVEVQGTIDTDSGVAHTDTTVDFDD